MLISYAVTDEKKLEVCANSMMPTNELYTPFLEIALFTMREVIHAAAGVLFVHSWEGTCQR
jgi:hypothetical protein